MIRKTIAFITLATAISGYVHAEQNQKCLPSQNSFFDSKEKSDLKHLTKSLLFLGGAYGVHRLTSNIGMPMLQSLVAGMAEGVLMGMSIAQILEMFRWLPAFACNCRSAQPATSAIEPLKLGIQECKELLTDRTLSNDARRDVQAQLQILEEAVANS